MVVQGVLVPLTDNESTSEKMQNDVLFVSKCSLWLNIFNIV